MQEYKTILGYLATAIAVFAYVIYFRQIFSGKIKPHAFSWFFWGLLTGIAFLAQLVKQGGSGTWVTGVTAIACFTISAWALVKGDRNFAKLDWLFLFTAIAAVVLWKITKDPTVSVVLVTLADAVGGTLPTIRKAYYRPHEESATVFFLSALKWIPAIFALGSFSLATWLYPASLILTNLLVVGTILIRRKELNTAKALA